MRFSIALSVLLLVGCASQRAERFNAEGNEKFKASDLPGAAVAFGEAVKLAPSVSKYHYNLGLSFARMGQMDAASTQLQEALRLDPANIDASRLLTAANTAIAARTRSY